VADDGTNSEGKIPTRPRFAKCDPAWLQMDLSGRELRVLLALSLHADWRPKGQGRCYPKRDTLALTTRLQISHVSEAIGTLSEEHRLITVVRLGRKNVYYIRPVGDDKPMPPSNAEPFFRFLGERNYFFAAHEGSIQYLPGSKNLADEPLLLMIFSDYARGLTTQRLLEAMKANETVYHKKKVVPA
jgi:hypothetical protein